MTLENSTFENSENNERMGRLKLLSIMADVAEKRLGSNDIEEISSMLRSIDMLEKGVSQIKENSVNQEEQNVCEEILQKIKNIREKANNN